ncbi:uncharacterized protein [Epargyreus clarus]|uniref:uncharacterized protein n=1 Tax=Epargyreus clarus TaxID=520877 RepID=UPI003C2DC4E0
MTSINDNTRPMLPIFETLSNLTYDYNYVPETTTMAILAEGEKKMSEYILDVLEHFQNPDPVGVPGAEIPEPIFVPDTRKSFGLTTLNFKETAVYGLSKFRIKHVNAEIGSMKITANMTIDNLEARGNCVASSFWSEVRSPYSVKLTGINVTGLATLGITREGKLTAQDIAIGISFQSITMNLKDAGALGFIITSFVNTGGNFLFESIKPYIMEEAYTKAREGINEKLDEIAGDIEFPNTISPLDMVIIDARKKVRAMKMDPFKIDDYNSSIGVFSAALSNTWITGLSSFKRVGNISLTLENNTVVADFEIGTEELEGRTQWELSAINGMISRVGTASFSVKYINGRIILAQPVDTRKNPKLVDLNLDVGNIQIRSDGAGTIDYILECAINIIPNLLRYQIVTMLETPMLWKIQQELNEFNVEEAIKQELPKIDEIQKRGFKLSELRAIKEETEDDEFFNF